MTHTYVLAPLVVGLSSVVFVSIAGPGSRKVRADTVSLSQSLPLLPPPREECVKKLQSGEEFDVLIIGGGATGAGAALDAAARGLKVACIEREDFSSGTSSRSTKLIWAGSRYLVNAVINLLNPDMRLLTSPIETIQKFRSEIRMVMNCHRSLLQLCPLQSYTQ